MIYIHKDTKVTNAVKEMIKKYQKQDSVFLIKKNRVFTIAEDNFKKHGFFPLENFEEEYFNENKQ